MLTAHNISKSFGVQSILDSVSFSLNPGERVGLVGPNGCGKTTLVRILAGLDDPDSGVVQLTPADLRVGYLPQAADFVPGETVGDFLGRQCGDVELSAGQVERLAGLPPVRIAELVELSLRDLRIFLDDLALSEAEQARLGSVVAELRGLPTEASLDPAPTPRSSIIGAMIVGYVTAICC